MVASYQNSQNSENILHVRNFRLRKFNPCQSLTLYRVFLYSTCLIAPRKAVQQGTFKGHMMTVKNVQSAKRLYH